MFHLLQAWLQTSEGLWDKNGCHQSLNSRCSSNCWSFRFFLYIYRVDHPSRAMFDLPSTLVIPNRAWIGLPHGSEVSGSAWAEPKQDQKALRSCKITQVLRKSSPQSVAFFRSAGFGVSFQLPTNQTQRSKSSLESLM
jgi:hypothetical protein